MKIYFDMCCLQRPLDDQTQLRIFVEGQAVLGVLAMCESGIVELIASESLVFESNANPDIVRRDFVVQVMAKAAHFIIINDQIKARAQTFVESGIKPLDALHLVVRYRRTRRFLLHM